VLAGLDGEQDARPQLDRGTVVCELVADAARRPRVEVLVVEGEP